MRVLVVKTSSMGDVIHTLPALTDAAGHFPDITFDWVVESSFVEVPRWHVRVDRVIPCAIRQWRSNWMAKATWHAVNSFVKSLRLSSYDWVIDAQGLIKSAIIGRLAKGECCGFDKDSIREPMACGLYRRCFSIERSLHAVWRVRRLFANVLGYSLQQEGLPDYGVERSRLPVIDERYPFLVFLHGTTWPSKHWPEPYWRQLAKWCNDSGMRVLLPWGSDGERARSQRIAQGLETIKVLPHLSLSEMAALLAKAKGVVAVDTGLGHLAAALSVPTLSLYGPTDPALTGTAGAYQTHLTMDFPCHPCLARTCTYEGISAVSPACFGRIPPRQVWQRMQACFEIEDFSRDLVLH